MAKERKNRSALPGFGLTMGYTLLYLSLIVLIPLAVLVIRSFRGGWEEFWLAATAPRVIASYKLTFRASLIAAIVNAIFGFIVAWTLVRYQVPGKKFIDALIDLPFALPTAVSGIALCGGLRSARLVRPVPGAAGNQDGLLAAGHRDRADVHRPAVRRADAAAGARGTRPRDGRSGGEPGRQPAAGLSAA